MGGCYTDYGSSCASSRSFSRSYESYSYYLGKFKKEHNIEDLVQSAKAYEQSYGSGFIAKVAANAGITDIGNIPKEFPEMEYEVKFDLRVKGRGKEPEITDYLNTFDFPLSKTARFIKDPINTSTIGINHFYGTESDERLVVIEKMGNTYLKEKSTFLPVEVGIKGQEAVLKRTEKRYPASLDQVLQKTNQVMAEPGVAYRGRIRKEKGDAFVLDTNDGRIYSFTITRAHLLRPGEEKESATQRQLELEYAGYILGFPNFQKDSEKQIAQGMVDLARYVWTLYQNAPLGSTWRMEMNLTAERKYDFVKGEAEVKALPAPEPPLLNPSLPNREGILILASEKKKRG